MITLYGIKTCETCRKATRALEEAGREVTVVDLRKDPPTTAFLEALIAAAPDKALNRSSATWRKLPDEEKARAETDLAGLLRDNPTLIKRPVIMDEDGGLYVGWNAETKFALGP
ncbi:arsenate reductase family protein [Parvularcula dongshanensis]|uniref:Arsenate reductase n=1 Tax=Parvularcula dongshanensis TaxID=1173995 RepID=A0A840I383_9PROT|nr:ArsC/Spx/MgsR family protein [Parvularcula dongshanensis]MBB4658733.1 arsenate reductase [Parvularcula dongshanensis]